MKSCNDDNIDSMLVYIYTLHTLAINYKIKLLVYQQVVRSYNHNLFTTSQGIEMVRASHIKEKLNSDESKKKLVNS